jgi:hypothetical protein
MVEGSFENLRGFVTELVRKFPPYDRTRSFTSVFTELIIVLQQKPTAYSSHVFTLFLHIEINIVFPPTL